MALESDSREVDRMIPALLTVILLVLIWRNTKKGVIPVSGTAKKLIVWARKEKGRGYLLGATGPNQWDCSSLVQGAYASEGIVIPRAVTEQAEQAPYSRPIQGYFSSLEALKEALRPGDCIGTGWNPDIQSPWGARYRHTGMYTEQGTIIHASSSAGKVVEVALSPWWFQNGRKIYAYT